MTLSVTFVILLFSIVQSVFGVGVLLFGTPTLLLMGYSYHETLYLILPSSILISFLQTISSYKELRHTMHVYIYTLPMVVLGLVAITFIKDDVDISIIVGSMLIMISLIRGVSFFKKHLKIFLEKNKVYYYVFMGLVHGLSNMGGGMLVVLMGSLHEKRGAILANIAYVYLLFGVVQMIALYFLSKELMNVDAILLAFASLAVYALSIRFVTKKINDFRFDLLITILILSYGILSFLKIG